MNTKYHFPCFKRLHTELFFSQISHFYIGVQYRLDSDLILNIDFSVSHEELKNWFGSSLMIVIFPFLQLGQHRRS